jgi:hypothetical protein
LLFMRLVSGCKDRAIGAAPSARLICRLFVHPARPDIDGLELQGSRGDQQTP